MSDEQDKANPFCGKPFDNLKIPDGMVWKYEAVLRGERLEHLWILSGEHGAVHIWAGLSEWDGRFEWRGGIECHYASAPEYMDADKPSHEHCWILGKPCWHDGSSLYFSENIAPMLPHAYEPWKAHDMAHVHNILLTDLWSWYRDNAEATATDTKEECE